MPSRPTLFQISGRGKPRNERADSVGSIFDQESVRSSSDEGSLFLNGTASAGGEGGGGGGDKVKCEVCEGMMNPGSSRCKTLDCKHYAHHICIEKAKFLGVHLICPMCRASEPASAEKDFADGAAIYVPIRDVVERGDDSGSGGSGESWGSLVQRQQRQMDEVKRLWEAAATNGHARAQFNLGRMFAAGKGVPRDDAEACAWIEKAAAQEDSDAQFNVRYAIPNP